MKKKKRKLQDKIQTLCILAFSIGFLGSYYVSKNVMYSFVIGTVGSGIIAAFSFYVVRKREQQILKSGIYDVDKMDGRQFEYYMSYLLKAKGYKVEVTPSSRDYGADLVLKENGTTIVVQLKRYSKNIGIQAVQEIVGAKGYYKAHEAWVISNRFYTPAAVSLSEANDVKLINRDDLIQWIIHLNPIAEVSPSQVIADVAPEKKNCPNCNCELTLKKGKFGSFWGCSGYPRCRFIYKG